MARKDSSKNSGHRGVNDIAGFVLIALAIMLLLAQLSFERNDIRSNAVPPNPTIHNWIGPVGAHMANGLFFIFGAGAFVLPILLLAYGLSNLIAFLGYLRRRRTWAVILFVSCLGFFDLYGSSLENLRRNLNAPYAGGQAGRLMNEWIFGHFGKPGATIIFVTAYLVSLVFLTNFRLGEWARMAWVSFRTKGEEKDGWTPEERALARKAKDLEKQAKKLAEDAARERSGLGADLKPVPAPTVRDLSLPQPRISKTTRPKAAEPEPERDGFEGEVIPAQEVAAATTADILGKAKPAKAGEPASAVESVACEEKTESSIPAPESISITDNTIGKAKKTHRKKPIAVAATPTIGNYQLPPLDFLQFPDAITKPTESREELMANARLMQSTLAQFDIEVALGDITKGPTITRYELHPAPGVRLEKITALNNNIAAALKAERINILAPVPGKSSVGVEVPNAVKTKVIIRDLLESEEWQKTKARIPLALGKDVYGHPMIADLADMPHLLIAGSTGSGKSVCINAIIASLLYRFPPDQLRFVMIDPKVVELQQYNHLPHLVVPVVNDPKKVILALRWVVNEMEKRYQIFAKVGVRNIKSFNERPKNRPLPPSEPELPLIAKKEKVEAGSEGFAVELDEEIVVPREDDIVIPEKLSYIVVIIDELADLMLVAPADVEMAIARITQMARAAGIHCIVATQRPSVDVITGVIKANIPARIAFQVAAKVDSRTILDAMGADKLLGKGDMLYLPPGSAKLIRAQGALIMDHEIQSIVDFIARQGKPSYEVEIHQQLSKPVSSFETEEGSDEDEDLIQQCIEVIRSEQKASVSLLQRRLRLGYTRAARIMDELENRGIVGPSKGAEPRDILIDLDGTGADGQAAAPA
ncbi:MAG: DNA translocase FtsK [Verrucomicrobia subdivision 3 bacterium]|nr:DNA translocase FtsK [Limisphaerales bacterium]